MRKHISLLLLAARSTVYKLAGLIVIMGAAQLALFYFNLQNNNQLGLEQAIAQSRISLVFGACFLLLCALVSLTGCELRGSKPRYTIQRLSVSEKTVTLWWSVYNTVCFIIFWAAELAIVLVLCRIYMTRGDPQHLSGQAVFLAAYRSKLFHSLLPLDEISRYFCNTILALGLGVSSACFSYNMRHDRRGVSVVVMAAVTAVFFQRNMGSFFSDITLSLLSVVVIAISISRMWSVDNDEA